MYMFAARRMWEGEHQNGIDQRFSRQDQPAVTATSLSRLCQFYFFSRRVSPLPVLAGALSLPPSTKKRRVILYASSNLGVYVLGRPKLRHWLKTLLSHVTNRLRVSTLLKVLNFGALLFKRRRRRRWCLFGGRGGVNH